MTASWPMEQFSIFSAKFYHPDWPNRASLPCAATVQDCESALQRELVPKVKYGGGVVAIDVGGTV